MLVYRIEDSNGYGAFRDIFQRHDHHAQLENLKCAFNHPGPGTWGERDTELTDFYNYDFWIARMYFRFGCRSKHQLRMWFRSENGRTAMAQAGGVMVTYFVPDKYVKHGRYQIAFDIAQATEISRVPANQW